MRCAFSALSHSSVSSTNCGVPFARRPSGGRFDFVPTLVRSRRCARGAPGAGEAAFETENPLVFAGMYPVLDPIAVLTTCLIGRRSCRSITARRNKAGLLRSRLSGFGRYVGAATPAVPSLTPQSKGRLSSLMATYQAACSWRAAARHSCTNTRTLPSWRTLRFGPSFTLWRSGRDRSSRCSDVRDNPVSASH